MFFSRETGIHPGSDEIMAANSWNESNDWI